MLKIDDSSSDIFEKSRVSDNVLTVLFTLNHCFIAITMFYLTWYCFQTEFADLTSYHVIVSVVGFLLMAEGMMVLYKENSYTHFVDKKATRTRIHWILLAIASVLAIAGSVIEYVNREKGGKKHFHSRHALWGLASMILLLPSMLVGITALFPQALKNYLKPLYSKFSHNLISIAAFVTGMVSLIFAYTDKKWMTRHNPIYMNNAITIITIIIIIITILRPVKTFCNHIESFFR